MRSDDDDDDDDDNDDDDESSAMMSSQCVYRRAVYSNRSSPTVSLADCSACQYTITRDSVDRSLQIL